ncbi:hypothetical protein T492DRAFT_856453 [Pavlovales sp. CCMP2436]|nr:hypothetical protein T492DRAFT_856453 [Pavlovales sp. CCMP2436]
MADHAAEDRLLERRAAHVQDMHRHMAQHQEVAKLVAWAHFNNTLPMVGALMVNRPMLKRENEKALKAAEDEERWLATLRTRSESSKAARFKYAHDLQRDASRSAHGTSSTTSDAGPVRAAVVASGVTAATERVRVRAQQTSSLAKQLREAPPAAALHFRRMQPYTANHVLPPANELAVKQLRLSHSASQLSQRSQTKSFDYLSTVSNASSAHAGSTLSATQPCRARLSRALSAADARAFHPSQPSAEPSLTWAPFTPSASARSGAEEVL